MAGLIGNIDVPDLATAEAFYAAAFGLAVARRLGPDVTEMTGLDIPLYLIAHPGRDYARHWTPVHPDIVVDDLDAALARAVAAGAIPETGIRHEAYGRIVTLADPFGHGFCLIQFTPEGYDAIAT